ncbi:glycogen synthase [Streptomyces sp. NPDC056661]|uniref:glycogen synthase n=1 Tax=Streptomyces sp. NPDC056661 TaxID=3345898 RepID=UPI0036767419
MRCLYITQEYAPLFAEGGLGLTSGSLPATLKRRHGWDHDIVLPYYPWLVERHGLKTEVVALIEPRKIGGTDCGASIHRLLECPDPCEIFLVRADTWYDRSGIYRDERYVPFPDEVERAAFFGSCVADWVALGDRPYDLIHGNDWQSGAAMMHLRERFPATPIVYSILSAVYQGSFSQDRLADLGLPQAYAASLGKNSGDQLSLFLTALFVSDATVTCSPTYAQELLGEFQGTPLGNALKDSELAGIVLGVDYSLWDPEAHGRPTTPFDIGAIAAGKKRNKSALQKRMGLAEKDLPMIGVCSRLVPEKGTDLLVEALADLLAQGRLQTVMIGPATDILRSDIKALKAMHPRDLAYVDRFDQEAAWLAYAGSDFTVMPSQVEPCGLNQLIAYRYGTIPIVSDVGGLRDTVTDVRRHPETGSGFIIPYLSAESVADTINVALAWMESAPYEVAAVRRRVISQDWSWVKTADEYANLFSRFCGHP